MTRKSCIRSRGLTGGWPNILFQAIIVLSTSFFHTVLARDCRTSWRRAWRDLSCEQQDEFLEAVLLVKETGIYDEFTILHEEMALPAHLTPEFLPWHRWFIYQFEKALQDATGKCIYLPYWDWERDSGFEWESTVFHEDTFGSYDGTRTIDGRSCTIDGIVDVNSSPFAWTPGMEDVPDGCLERAFTDEFSFEGESEVLAKIVTFDQFANTARGDDVNGFSVVLEEGGHAAVHAIVGGHMGSNWSPADPLFYLHHANVDRLWSIWQDYWDHDECGHNDYDVPWHYDGNRLDDRLPFGSGDTYWDFRMVYEDGSLAYPTARDVLSNDSPNFHVKYQNDYLASLLPEYEPNPRLFQVAEDTVDIRCDRDEWRKKIRQLRNLVDDNNNNNKSDGSSHRTGTLKHQFFSTKKSSMKGVVIEKNATNTEEYPATCRQRNLFTRQEDRDEWDSLCKEMPSTTTVAERLAVLAERDCERRGNPRTDSKAVMDQLHMMAMGSAPLAAYACFHRPDQA